MCKECKAKDIGAVVVEAWTTLGQCDEEDEEGVKEGTKIGATAAEAWAALGARAEPEEQEASVERAEGSSPGAKRKR